MHKCPVVVHVLSGLQLNNLQITNYKLLSCLLNWRQAVWTCQVSSDELPLMLSSGSSPPILILKTKAGPVRSNVNESLLEVGTIHSKNYIPEHNAHLPFINGETKLR